MEYLEENKIITISLGNKVKDKIKSKFKASEIRAILFNLIPVKFACHLLNLSLQSYFIIYSNSYTIIICILCFNKTIC